MNSVQMHLALTHVPVVLSLAGLAMLVVSFFIKNNTLTKTSYFLLLIAGVAAIPVFLTGEGTEEAIEKLPGVSESVIERHEEVAKLAMIAIAVAGVIALSALLSDRWRGIARVLKFAVLLLAISGGWLMAQTAHLGGQIRHTEIRSGAALQNSNEQQGGNDGQTGQENDD
jgi:uncharacterized membrane protein